MLVVLTGGSGFIGTALSKRLLADGHQVIIFDRVAPKFSHERLVFQVCDFSEGSIPGALADADAIVHLAGASIFERWTEAYKKVIVSSRVDSLHAMLAALGKSGRPKVLVCASAVGYYGDAGDAWLPETAPAGSDFLAQVCRQWEAAAAEFEQLGMRRVSVRTAIVLGPGGGMMSKLVPLFTWGLGGRLGSGHQWFSWIHLDDLVEVYVQSIMNPALQGPINACAPHPVTNADFTRVLAATLHRPAWFRVPAWGLRLILGEFSRAVLSSQRTVPEALHRAGFVWKYPTLEKALAEKRS